MIRRRKNDNRSMSAKEKNKTKQNRDVNLSILEMLLCQCVGYWAFENGNAGVRFCSLLFEEGEHYTHIDW